MIFLNINIYKEMPKTKNWKCKKTQNFEHSLPKGRLRSEAQEKPDGQNKLILCSLAELQKND